MIYTEEFRPLHVPFRLTVDPTKDLIRRRNAAISHSKDFL